MSINIVAGIEEVVGLEGESKLKRCKKERERMADERKADVGGSRIV